MTLAIEILSLMMLAWINGFIFGHSAGFKRSRELATQEKEGMND